MNKCRLTIAYKAFLVFAGSTGKHIRGMANIESVEYILF